MRPPSSKIRAWVLCLVAALSGVANAASFTVEAPGVLANDSWANWNESSGPSLFIVEQARHGVVNIRSDGGFSYKPADGYQGLDSFKYILCANGRISDPATVTLNASLATPDPVDFGNVLFLGDSITEAGQKAVDGDGNRSWRYSFWKKMIDANNRFAFVGSRTSNNRGPTVYPTYNGAVFENRHEGKWGTTSTERLNTLNSGSYWSDLDRDGSLKAPDTAFILIGSNDLEDLSFGSAAATNFVNRVRQMVTQLQAANPNVAVFLISILPRFVDEDGDGFNEKRIENANYQLANQGMDDLEESNSTTTSTVTYVNVYPFVQNTWLYDGIHPNLLGETNIATITYNKALAVVGGSLPSDPNADPDSDGVRTGVEVAVGRNPLVVDEYPGPIFDDFSNLADGDLAAQPGIWSFAASGGTAIASALADRVELSGAINLRAPLAVDAFSERQAIEFTLQVTGSNEPPDIPEGAGAALYFDDTGKTVVLNGGVWSTLPAAPRSLDRAYLIAFLIDVEQGTYDVRIDGEGVATGLALPDSASKLREARIQHSGAAVATLSRFVFTELEDAPLSYVSWIGGQSSVKLLAGAFDPNADLDADGLPNWLEFLQRSDLLVFSSNATSLGWLPGRTQLEFTLANIARPDDMKIRLMTSEDLVHWAEEDLAVQRVETRSLPERETLTWGPLPSGESRRFWRLEVLW